MKSFEEILLEKNFLEENYTGVHRYYDWSIIIEAMEEFLEQEPSLKKLVRDFLPDVASREQSERATGNEGAARATLPARPSANADGLLPCPFCGYEPTINFETPENSNRSDYFTIISCMNCYATIESNIDKDKLIKVWNTRHGNAL